MSPSKILTIPENFSEHGVDVDLLIDVIHWFMIALFIGWTLFFLLCLWKFWHKNNPKAQYHGVKNHVSSHLEIAVVIIEAVILLGIAFPLWWDRSDTYEEVAKLEDTARVRAVGYQFGWKYHYPGADGKFGRIDRRLVSAPGDPCIDPDDPNGWDDFITTELQIPVNRHAIIQVTSTDVIHNYSIVPMRIQQDAIPGTDIPMWFKPKQKIETYVVCGQLCGKQHAEMKTIMKVVSQGAYDAMVKDQSERSLKANQEKRAKTAQR